MKLSTYSKHLLGVRGDSGRDYCCNCSKLQCSIRELFSSILLSESGVYQHPEDNPPVLSDCDTIGITDTLPKGKPIMRLQARLGRFVSTQE